MFSYETFRIVPLWGYVVIVAVGIALAAWVVVLVVFMLARADAPSYWDDGAA